MKKLFLLLLCLPLMCCSRVTIAEEEGEETKNDTTQVIDKEEEEQVEEDESYHDVSLHYQITHVQPMTGMVLWNDMASEKQSTHGKSIALEFSYVQPCKLVTGKKNEKLQYDWSYLEQKLNAAASRGHQMVVRFPLCYPSNRDNCSGTKGATYVPDYIKQMSDYKETYSSNPGGDGPTYYPDWSHAELQWFVKEFYKDVAEHYNNDNRLAFVEVGFGHWGEYHTYGTKVNFGTNFPTKDYQKQLFKWLGDVMQIPWLVSIDAGDEAYSDMATDATIKQLAFGLFDDSFMHKEHDLSQGDGWNEQCWQWSGLNRWEKGVCGGEISYYSSADQKNFLNPSGMYGVTWEQAAAKYHMSFIICNDAPLGNYFTPERVNEAGIASGYAFEITSCRTNEEDTHITIKNTGIAPIYRDAYVTVKGIRCTKSLKGLLPGKQKTFVIKKAVAEQGNISITSDFILSKQEIQFEANLP